MPPRPHTRPPVGPVSYLAACALFLGLTGCSARADRADAEVAKIVEREDRRQAQRAAVAALDLETLELASAAAAIEAMALLYVPAPEDKPADVEVAPPASAEAPNWHYEGPAGWAAQPWPLSMEGDADAAALQTDGRSKRREGIGGLTLAPDAKDGGSGKRSGKLKLGFNLLRMRIKDKPINFSGSLKGLKGVQVTATVKW